MMSQNIALWLACLFALSIKSYDCKGMSGASCMDYSNNPVDWFIIYKLPVYHGTRLNKDHPFPPHLYMDSVTQQFEEVNLPLNSTWQPLAMTLQQAYDNHLSEDVGYIFYNDEKPLSAGGKTSFYLGHTKGVVVFDSEAGFWLVHSAPKFPPPSNVSYSYPHNAIFYGQHFLCVSLAGRRDITNVGIQLTHNQPYVYDFNLPWKLKALYPVMDDVAHREWSSRTNHTALIRTPNGINFLSFAKTREFGEDLYADLVATSLQCDMKVETWQHGKHNNMPSSCSTAYNVENVKRIGNDGFEIDFSNYEDHSKFAVCTRNWICVGDVNRQKSQEKRGGGTVCFSDKDAHKQYVKIIEASEDCPNAYN